MNAFYPAFSPACFSLLGLWLVVVQIRQPQWQASPDYPVYRKASYGIALHFLLPALMSVLALVDQNDRHYWQVSFAVIALGGAVTLVAMRGLGGFGVPRAGTGLSFPVGGTLAVAAYAMAIAAYLAVGALAIHGAVDIKSGPGDLNKEEVLLTGLVFLGFNAAWLLLFYDGATAPESPDAGEPTEDLAAD